MEIKIVPKSRFSFKKCCTPQIKQTSIVNLNGKHLTNTQFIWAFLFIYLFKLKNSVFTCLKVIFKDHFSTLTNQVVYKFTRCIQENKHFYAEKDMFVEQTDVAPQTKMSTERFFLFSIKAEHFYFIQSISNFSRLFWLLLRTFFTLCFKSA